MNIKLIPLQEHEKETFEESELYALILVRLDYPSECDICCGNAVANKSNARTARKLVDHSPSLSY